MPPGELRNYIHKVSVESDEIEGYIMDLALYGDGVISYSELMSMPLSRIKLFEARLNSKIQAASGKKGKEYL
jgi:hypothetical protein